MFAHYIIHGIQSLRVDSNVRAILILTGALLLQHRSLLCRRTRNLVDPSPNLAVPSSGYVVLEDHGVHLLTASVQIRFARLDEPCAEDDLVSEVHDDEQDKTDVGHEEASGVPRDECGETLGENDENVEKETVPGQPRLPHSLVRKGVTGLATDTESAHEGNVADVNGSPRNESSNTTDVEEPVEDGTTSTAEVDEAKESEDSSSRDSDVRYTTLTSP